MKNLKNNFGIKYVSVAEDSFFESLKKPVDKKRIKQATKFTKGSENVKIDLGRI
ncbi:MAG: hypothetical protein IJU89_04180 [Alphaproteobacteria bacterium]|nr:hypothetical protein [Alphaproteobacteria bacterium]